MRIFTLSLLIAFFIAPAAFAAKINDKGAEKLKSLFETLISEQQTALKIQGGELKMIGDLTIEQAKKYYAVTLPEMNYIDADGKQTHIGLVAINATPTKDPDDWKMSVAIPTPILRKDEAGNIINKINIGSQNMVGLWQGELNNFSKLSSSYKDIVIQDGKQNNAATIKDIELVMDLKETGKNLWSGPTRFDIKGLSLSSEDKGNFINIDKATIAVAIDNFDSSKTQEFRQNILSAAESPEAELPSDFWTGMMAAYGDSMKMQGSLENISFTKPGQTDKGSKKINLEKVGFNYTMSGMNEDTLDQSLGLIFKGDKSAQKENSIFPTVVETNISIKNLPFAEILDIGKSALPQKGANQNAPQMAALQAMMTLPQMLADAGTVFSIKDTQYGNSEYNVEIDGLLKANKSSMLGTTGDIDIVIEGMDNIISALEAQKTGGNTAKIDQSIQMVQALRLVSEQKGDKNIYDIEITEEAKVLINGKDASALMGGR
jgi:hypothetical protein